MAVGHVHHHLVTLQKRSRVGLLLETAEAREVHHFCLLLGYGVDAVCPYLAFDTLGALREDGHILADLTDDALADNYIKVGRRTPASRLTLPAAALLHAPCGICGAAGLCVLRGERGG